MDNFDDDEIRSRLAERINSISSLFKINYPLNPSYQYLYPPINEIVIQNIVSALITNEKFYYQTLHLMNKMCLPCPFVQNMFTNQVPYLFEHLKDTVKTIPMVIETSSSSSESEIESEGVVDVNSKKRPRLKSPQVKKIKVIKPQKNDSENKKEQKISIEDVFETDISNLTIESKKVTKKNFDMKKNEEIDNKYILIEPGIDNSGFGKIIPVNEERQEGEKRDKPIDETCQIESTEFITKKELDNNRMSLTELNELAVFKNYEKGELNKRLYIKNLSKKVDETHLRHIYGRYIDFNNQEQKELFDIRLMKEGRMKGQAFVTLPNEEIANKALIETNGYVLTDKPLVVQFARSAKPKT